MNNTKAKANRNNTVSVGILGTGYIADFHAAAIQRTLGVGLAAVCDADMKKAHAFASKYGGVRAHDSLENMLADSNLDTVHILTPPNLHFAQAKRCLQSGVSVFLEKPVCASVTEAEELIAIASERKLQLGVNHNMLYSEAYRRLREAVLSLRLGPLKSLAITHYLELGQIRFGPFDSWMLQAPGNVLLELGPHLCSVALDLAGPLSNLRCIADRAQTIPGGKQVFRRWRIEGDAQGVAVSISIDIGPGFGQRTISTNGIIGSAFADLDADTCHVDRKTSYGPDFDRFLRSRSLARQVRMQSFKTLADYGLTRVGLRKRGNPYELSMNNSIAAFYEALTTRTSLDKRLQGQFGRDVISMCLESIDKAQLPASGRLAAIPKTHAESRIKPTVLVLGATGFIGRELIRQLIAEGHKVRAMVRGSAAVLEEFDVSRLQVMRGDMRSNDDLRTALQGIQFVYHLARANANSWAEYLRLDVEPTRQLAKLCLDLDIERLVYTGTIDSYYAGAGAGLITEDSPLDPGIQRRNYYARAKAEAEKFLTEMHRDENLPIVIARPGIVIGKHGNPFHWGVGKWSSPGVCQVWGDGHNKLPFVLVKDVADGLVRCMTTQGIEGRSYNLIDAPLVTAHDYLAELQLATGMKLDVDYTPIWKFFATDSVKWLVKVAVGHHDRIRRPSYQDWESRTQKAEFDCSRTRKDLNWQPASDRVKLIDEGLKSSLEDWFAAIQ